MADVTPTPAAVVAGAGAEKASGTAGAAITAGDFLYRDATDSNSLRPATAITQVTAAGVGIALHAAEDGQPITYATRGPVTLGTDVLTVAEIYVASNGPGLIAPVGDLTTGEWVTIVGYALDGDTIQLQPIVENLQVPS